MKLSDLMFLNHDLRHLREDGEVNLSTAVLFKSLQIYTIRSDVNEVESDSALANVKRLGVIFINLYQDITLTQ